MPVKKLILKKRVSVDSKSSYVSYDSYRKMLWVGEYAADFAAPLFEHHKNFSGKKSGWLSGYHVNGKGLPTATTKYKIKHNNKYIKVLKPDLIIPVVNNLQGASIYHKNKLAVTNSRGKKFSLLKLFTILDHQKKTLPLPGKNKGLAYATKEFKHIALASGAEDLEYDSKRNLLFIGFETLALEYRQKRGELGDSRVLAFNMNKIEKL